MYQSTRNQQISYSTTKAAENGICVFSQHENQCLPTSLIKTSINKPCKINVNNREWNKLCVGTAVM